MKKFQAEEIFQKLKLLQKHAYAPYSNFRVAAIVVLNDGTEIAGVNVENAAYSAGICAERSALAQVITQGYKINQIKSIFLITDSKTIGSPCGVCRQFMVEIMPYDSEVLISNNKMTSWKEMKKFTVKELLPFAFVQKSLEG